MPSKPLYLTSPDPKTTGWPGGIPFIVGNEGCERFSYYGMRAILYIYVAGLLMTMTGQSMDQVGSKATQITHLFYSAVYGMPIIGAILADRLWGKYRTIMYLSVVYCLGHLVLAVFENSTWQQRLLGHVYVTPMSGLYLGLALIAIGSGGIKPCVTAHVGDQFGAGNWHLLQKVFNIFYFIINFGSASSTIIIPAIRGRMITGADNVVSYQGSITLAFAVPGILMGLATFFFWLGRRKFVHVPPTRPGRLGLLDFLSGSALFLVIGFPIFGYDPLQEWVHAGGHPRFVKWGVAGSGSEALVVWSILGALSAICLVLFVVLFSVRQSIEQDDGFLSVLFHCVKSRIVGGDANEGETAVPHGENGNDGPGGASPTGGFFGPAARKFGSESVEGSIAVLKIMSVFVFVSVFWALFDQHTTTWVDQARQMELTVGLSPTNCALMGGVLSLLIGAAVLMTLRRGVLVTSAGSLAVALLGGLLGLLLSQRAPSTFTLMPSQIPAANPFMVMLLIPYTTFGLYPLMAWSGIAPTPLRRMSAGMFIAAVAFVSVALLQMRLDRGDTLHVFWQLIPYFIMTLSEVMVSITGLEFAYSQAPRKMKSVIMGFWHLNVSFGNVLVVLIAKLPDMPLARFFWVFAGLMAAAAFLFTLRAAFYRYNDYTQ